MTEPTLCGLTAPEISRLQHELAHIDFQYSELLRLIDRTKDRAQRHIDVIDSDASVAEKNIAAFRVVGSFEAFLIMAEMINK